MNQFSRMELLLGSEAIERLKIAYVAIFGLGGVGSWAVEALARAGVGKFLLVDADRVCVTNINRQLIATHGTIGKDKTEVMYRRILEINPNAIVERAQCFYSAESADSIDLNPLSYVVDAIDTVSSKLLLIKRSKAAGVPIISCMGTGNKLNPQMLETDDIFNTTVCPLARVMRRELKALGIDSLKVVYSKEIPISPTKASKERQQVPGSVPFVPPVAGMILASEVVKGIINCAE